MILAWDFTAVAGRSPPVLSRRPPRTAARIRAPQQLWWWGSPTSKITCFRMSSPSPVQSRGRERTTSIAWDFQVSGSLPRVSRHPSSRRALDSSRSNKTSKVMFSPCGLLGLVLHIFDQTRLKPYLGRTRKSRRFNPDH